MDVGCCPQWPGNNPAAIRRKRHILERALWLRLLQLLLGLAIAWTGCDQSQNSSRPAFQTMVNQASQAKREKIGRVVGNPAAHARAHKGGKSAPLKLYTEKGNDQNAANSEGIVPGGTTVMLTVRGMTWRPACISAMMSTLQHLPCVAAESVWLDVDGGETGFTTRKGKTCNLADVKKALADHVTGYRICEQASDDLSAGGSGGSKPD
jgi:hypothetical protein